ncbi:ATP-binding protein [Streptomyces mirabilis]
MFVTDAAVTDPPHDLGVGIDGSHGRNVFLAPATQDQTGSLNHDHPIILDHKCALRHPRQALSIHALVVSELVTNALKYALGPLLMELRITARAVDVVVWDSEPTVPAARAADPDRIGQHGLEIVKAVTEDLFTEQEPVGKRITARLALSDDPGGDVTGRRHQ